MVVNGNLVTEYTDFVTGAMSAFLPLVSTIIGVFVAFAIANLIRFYIQKAVK